MGTAKHLQNGLAALLCMVASQRMGGLHEELEGSSDWIAEILPNIQLALCEEQLPSAEKDGALKAVDWMVSHNRRSGGLESEPFDKIAHANNTHCCCAALRSPLRVYVDSLGPCSVDGSTSSCSRNGSSAL
jgi:prenyltransferase beta subunit